MDCFISENKQFTCTPYNIHVVETKGHLATPSLFGFTFFILLYALDHYNMSNLPFSFDLTQHCVHVTIIVLDLS